MKKFLLLIAISITWSCQEQSPKIESVFDYITYVVENSSAKSEPVKLEIIGSNRIYAFKWMAIISKSNDSCNIDFYRTKEEALVPGLELDELEFIHFHDTTYAITMDQFRDNMIVEEELSKTRRIIDDVYIQIKISRENDTTKFQSKNIEGLIEILRHNRFYQASNR